MSSPVINQNAPTFDLPATGDQNLSSNDFAGKNIVLYFYPRDDTPGCTTESKDFRDTIDAFNAANTVILGISQDTVASHEKFKEKFDMPFDLLSDEDGSVCTDYDVIKLKKMYGKEFLGIERSTFLIDGEGVLKQSWLKVKVPGHVDEVLKAAQAL